MSSKHPTTLHAPHHASAVCMRQINQAADSGSKRLVATVDLVKCDKMTPQMEEVWITLAQQSGLDSPYFHPAFAQSVAAVRDDVEVAVLKDSTGKIVGFFPFQRITKRSASPIGGRMNDFQKIIMRPNTDVDLKFLLQQIGVSRIPFHAWEKPDPQLKKFCFENLNSYFVDLSDGFAAYDSWLIQNSSTIKRLPQKIRSLERNVGKIRFEFECDNPLILEKLIELKRRKFQRTNTFDILSVEWAANLLRQISRIKTDEFRGVLSALWAGDRLVAAQFGMLNDNLLHYWFPVYAQDFSKYSPGLQLMYQSCQAAAQRGIRKIDMSYGESSFKDKFCNGKTKVAVGAIDFNQFRHFAAKKRYAWRINLKSIPFKKQLKAALRSVFPGYGKWHFK